METKLDFNREVETDHILITKVPGSNLMLNVKPEPEKLTRVGDVLEDTVEFSGVFCKGVQYYDLKDILFINYTGLANLIKLLKSLLRKGSTLQLVNVNEKIKEKIKEVGLDNIIDCK